jgi:hypothetical protein
MTQLLFGIILGVIIVVFALFNWLYINRNTGADKSRQLTLAQREQFLKLLCESPGGNVNVTAVHGNRNSINFANELDNLLNKAGWPTRGVKQAIFTGNPTGLILTVNSSKETPPYASKLQHILKTIGLPVSAEMHTEDPIQSLNLTVGDNPNPK